MKQAMIFAAGLGTRLKPLTDTMPKALVPVEGEPMLKRVILRLKAMGMDRVVVNVHHFADMIIDYLAENNNFGMDIRISDEREQLLDTGGGLKKAGPLFDPSAPILVHNVDILSNLDLQRFYDEHGDADASLVVSKRETSRYLLFDIDNVLCGWVNVKTGEVKTPYIDVSIMSLEDLRLCFKFYAFSGIHIFNQSLFKEMESWEDRFSIIDFYLNSCNKYQIKGCLYDDLKVLDIGKPETLANAGAFLDDLNKISNNINI